MSRIPRYLDDPEWHWQLPMERVHRQINATARLAHDEIRESVAMVKASWQPKNTSPDMVSSLQNFAQAMARLGGVFKKQSESLDTRESERL